MRRASPFSGIALRSAVAVLAVFAIVLPVTGYAILRNTQTTIEEQIRSAITGDVNLLHDANVAGGEGELINFIHDSLATRSDRQFAFGLFKRDGRPIAGNIDSLPHFRGWGELDHGVGGGDGSPFLGYVEALDDDVIVVGHSQRAMSAISNSILGSLIVAGVVLGIAAIGIGYALNRQVSVKLAVIDRTLDAVSRGNGDIRLPIGHANDQIDHVSEQINAHLDRLSDYMASMRNTIVAIAHDLKSPLHRAYMLLQEATDSAQPGSSGDKLERALAEMEALREIIETVLRISRIESSDDSSRFSTFSAADLLRDLAQTFEPVLQGAGQTLDASRLVAGSGTIRGDRRMIAQLLVNLIENANRYAGDGAKVALKVETGPDGGTLIKVSDSGPGIPEAFREEVFEPFRRLEPERNLPGAGLGLALVNAIAVRHHAHVTLGDNAPGLVVTVAFPPAPLTSL